MRSQILHEDEVIETTAMFDIGASGAHTKTSNVPGKMVASVARTAAGKYTVTFARGVPTGPFIGFYAQHWPAANAGPLLIRPTVSGYTAETAAAAATLLFEAWDLDTTAQTELASGDKVTYRFQWLKTR